MWRSGAGWRLATMLGLAILALTQAPAGAADPIAPAFVQPAPSFDCARARSATEHAICDDPALAAADVNLAAAFHALAAPLSAEDHADLVGNQRRWLGTLATDCGADRRDRALAECLAGVFNWRADTLRRAAEIGTPGLAALLWTDAVLCDGNRFLIRFAPEDVIAPDLSEPAPAIGGRLARLPSAPRRECRLADGRLVRLRLASAQDSLAFGYCGGDQSQLWSLWIGGRKVVNREVRRDKCDEGAVRAVWYDGRALVRCVRTHNEGVTVASGAPRYRQACSRYRPARDRPTFDERAFRRLASGVFAVTWAAPGMAGFCRGLIRPRAAPRGQDQIVGGFVSDLAWPRMTAAPRRPLDTRRPVDLDNSGRLRPVYRIETATPWSDGAFFIVAPPGHDARARAAAAFAQARLIDGPELDRRALRRRGLEVFDADQTPYGDSDFVSFTPFRRAGATWLFATWGIPLARQPVEIVTRPRPDGGQSLVCRYQATPDI